MDNCTTEMMAWTVMTEMGVTNNDNLKDKNKRDGGEKQDKVK